MTTQTGQEIITIHILSNISRSQDNQPMNLGQLIKHNVRNIFFHKSCRKRGRETSSRPFFIFKNALYKVKEQVLSTLVLIYFGTTRFGQQKQTLQHFKLLI